MSEVDVEAFAFRVALLADVHMPLPWLWKLWKAPPADPRVRTRVALRLAELLRRFDPEEAAIWVELAVPGLGPTSGSLTPDALRAAIALERGNLDEARTLLPLLTPGDGVAALLSGRLAWQQGDAEGASAAFDQSIAEATDPEVLAEALGFRARMSIAAHGTATEDLDRLEALCVTHGAGISQTIVRVLREVGRTGVMASFSEGLSRGAWTWFEAKYTFGHTALADQIAPIPLVVHGAAHAHADEPDAYAGAILAMSSVCWRAGDTLRGFEIAYYGLRIGQRIFDADPMIHLERYLTELDDSMTPEARAALHAKVHERAKRG